MSDWQHSMNSDRNNMPLETLRSVIERARELRKKAEAIREKAACARQSAGEVKYGKKRTMKAVGTD